MCNNSYDNTDIEHMLIDTISRKAMASILQDLQCRKCLQVNFFNSLKLQSVCDFWLR